MKLLINKILAWIVSNKILFLILVVASLLRFIGTSPGYQPFHPDEGMSYSSATSMIKDGNIDPLRYDYPSLIPIINVIFFKLIFIPVYWTGFYLIHIFDFLNKTMSFPLSGREYQTNFQNIILGWRDTNALAWTRIITALFGLGNVILSYLITRKLFSKNTALIAASLVAVNYRQVLNSHFGLPDIYNSFFLMLALLSEIYLFLKPDLKNYLITALLIGLSISTKYQFFSLIPFIIIHLYLSSGKKSWQNKIQFLFSPKAILVPLIIITVFVVLNPYHILNLQKTITQVSYSAAKYQAGRMQLDFYSYWYLYEIGIGKITSLLVLFGVAIMLLKQFKQAIFLLSVILPFLFMMTYYSFGGYYTRNFVTITPLILIFAAFLIYEMISLKAFRKFKLLFLITLIFILWENFSNAVVVPQEYSKSWNYRILAPWFAQNIPGGSKVAAHSSVFFPMEKYERLPYNFAPAFSMDEFREMGADFAIANLDIMTDDFYWWMGKIEPFKMWNKPVDILEQTYPAMAIRELSDSAVFSVINRWQAPDSDFIVAKIPDYKILTSKKVIDYTFGSSDDGWEKVGQMGHEDKSLSRENGNLVIRGGGTLPILRWESKPILVDHWDGFLVEAKMKSETIQPDIRDGYIFANFYPTIDDATDKINRIGVRISSRNNHSGDWVTKSLIGKIPQTAKYLTIGFGSYGPQDSVVYLSGVTLYQTKLEVNYSGWEVKPLKLDPNILFPFSHGML